MFQLLRHRIRHRRELLREQIPAHFIPIICTMTAIVYIPTLVLAIAGKPGLGTLISPMLWVLGMIILVLITFTGKRKYDPDAHRAAEIHHQRQVLRRRHPDLRDVTDTYIDDIYHLRAVTRQ